ncbi:MAG: hypothetical protein HZC49_13735 [Nitrospirae bacterium]|nr:hypothetical protein [Nitrospirota bacterium]
MIINSSDVSMASKYSLVQHYEKTEELQMWVGQENPFEPQENQPASQDRVSITEDARNYVAKNQEAAEAEEADNEEGVTGKLMLIKLLVESFTGKKINLKDMKEMADDSDSAETAGGSEEAPVEEGQPERAGWGLIYNSSESYYEHEKLSFKAKGTITTADGREIDFKLHFKLDRKYMSEESVSIRAGDAVLTDPLVINYGGPAADLTDTKFSFDLDADGTEENISFVRPGSGILTLDLNNDGTVNNGTELFGPSTGNGFAELAAYDEDGNKWIDEKDSVFTKLRIWTKDAEGANILFSLKEKDVGAIYLENIATEFNLKDAANQLNGQIASTGLYLNEDGTPRTVQQVDIVA